MQIQEATKLFRAAARMTGRPHWVNRHKHCVSMKIMFATREYMEYLAEDVNKVLPEGYTARVVTTKHLPIQYRHFASGGSHLIRVEARS